MARRSRLSPFAFVRRMGLYKGLLGGSRGWLVAGGTLYAGRLIKRLFGRSEEVLSTEVLKGGQFVHLSSIKPPTRRERKQDARDRKAAATAAKAAAVAAKAARKAAKRS